MTGCRQPGLWELRDDSRFEDCGSNSRCTPTTYSGASARSERITLRELLKRRIDEEVAELNAGREEIIPLVTPTEHKRRLNGERPDRRPVDATRLLAAAVEAFERRRIVVIVDGGQALDLDQSISVTAETEVRTAR